MTVTELLDTFLLLALLLFCIWGLNYFLNKLVFGPSNRLFLALSIFILMSGIIFLMYHGVRYIDDPTTNYSIYILFACLWWFAAGYLLIQLLSFFIWSKFLLRDGAGINKLLRDLLSLVIFIITVALITHFVFNRSAVGIFVVLAVITIILGYSAQNVLRDIFSGIGLNLANQFREGDLIKVMGLLGVESAGIVKDINWRFVNLLTADGNNLSIPNSIVARQPITNYSRPYPTRGIKITLPLSAGLSPERVKNVLISSALSADKIANHISPKARLIQSQGEINTYQLTCYTKETDEDAMTDEILSIIWYQLKRNGLIEHTEEKKYTATQIKQYLQKTDLFSVLTAEEVTALAKNSVVGHYGPPERILEQGQKSTSLFLIMNGGVDAYITSNNKIMKIASFQEGEYFGEMSLLTGEPCNARIVVSTESTLIEINHSSMMQLFNKRPELMEKMSEVLVMQTMKNVEVSEDNEKLTINSKKTKIARMAYQIRSFFRKKVAQK
ncbi:cyclic nucleotide-binding protein (plasmid) [Legionella adelaidensis]|uniref:Small-conductance mechanosensitive channel n=1 Tax=Legionella adelaidensis TaxID=45056 RepID=A0A0W0R409_9GAMM|nr:mechanosensitive ion channel family protein [Legionella adelaidensis]KTC65758.1 cyclic nucleotide-binding protein [Legionella adelaidensis]VEH85300.1 cyclic nucleotide-binding protein [Legionella adelaidensis]